jgi:hypothetical protein
LGDGVRGIVTCALATFPLIFTDVKRYDTIVIGDSEACAVSRLAANDGVPSFCKVSSRIEWWASNAPERAKNARIVVIFLGANNCDDKAVEVATHTLLVELKAERCVWVGPPMIRNKVCNASHLLEETLVNRCTFIDSSKLPIQQRDGVHPTTQGAEFWWSEVAKNLVAPIPTPKYIEVPWLIP